MKSKVKIKGGIASKGEVVVTDGAVHVTLATAPTTEGYGESQLKGGTASKNEVTIVDGAVSVRIA